jgi:hypothetical protein
MIPFEAMPGIPRLFLAFVRGEAGAFFADAPTVESAIGRAREVRARRGGPAVVAVGQQAGLLGGPLLALTKAAAAAGLARKIADAGEPCRGLFWIASEDHDLNEIAQATILRDGAPETFRLPVKPRNFQPAGTVLVPPEINEFFARLEGAEGPPEIVGRFARAWSPGRPYAQAFRDTLEPLLADATLDWLDPMDDRWKEKEQEFFRKVFGRAKEIVGALDAADRSLRDAGYEPQVGRAERDFPAFVIEGLVRSKISWDGAKFSVHGRDEAFSAEALSDFVAAPGNRPSAAALLRPVLQSHLFPVAASILGPSELSYHAQTAPLFDVLELPRPVFLPRPHLRGAPGSVGLSSPSASRSRTRSGRAMRRRPCRRPSRRSSPRSRRRSPGASRLSRRKSRGSTRPSLRSRPGPARRSLTSSPACAKRWTGPPSAGTWNVPGASRRSKRFSRRGGCRPTASTVR